MKGADIEGKRNRLQAVIAEYADYFDQFLVVTQKVYGYAKPANKLLHSISSRSPTAQTAT